MAAITASTNNTESVPASQNASSAYVKVGHGVNKITVYSASWSGSKAAALMFTPILDDAAVGAVKDQSGSAVSFTANESVDMRGPGFVRIDVTNSNGSPVYLAVNKCELI